MPNPARIKLSAVRAACDPEYKVTISSAGDPVLRFTGKAAFCPTMYAAWTEAEGFAVYGPGPVEDGRILVTEPGAVAETLRKRYEECLAARRDEEYAALEALREQLPEDIRDVITDAENGAMVMRVKRRGRRNVFAQVIIRRGHGALSYAWCVGSKAPHAAGNIDSIRDVETAGRIVTRRMTEDTTGRIPRQRGFAL